MPPITSLRKVIVEGSNPKSFCIILMDVKWLLLVVGLTIGWSTRCKCTNIISICHRFFRKSSKIWKIIVTFAGGYGDTICHISLLCRALRHREADEPEG